MMGVIVALAVAGANLGHAGLRTPFTCPRASVLCIEQYGHNYQVCGELPDAAGAAEIFPLCPDIGAMVCAPCALGGAQATKARCQATFGETCSFFITQDRDWSQTGGFHLSPPFDWWDQPN